MKPHVGPRALLVLGVLLAALSGCQQEGPAEQAGKEVDKAMSNIGEQMEKAGEEVQDSVQR
jgi:predicted small lipoprotein YifL